MQMCSNQEIITCITRLRDQGNFTKANRTRYYETNLNRFILSHSSPLLQLNTARDLGHSGEGQLSRNMLWSMKEIVSTNESLKDLMKLFHNSS